jgi:hypothetical protein
MTDDNVLPFRPEPGDALIDGNALATGYYNMFARCLILPEGGETLLTFFCLVSHILPEVRSIQYAPRLMITAPVPESAKTVTMAMLSCGMLRAEACSGISESDLFRTIDENEPSMIIDEIDQIRLTTGLKRVLNSGHYRPLAWERRRVSENKQWVTRKFSTFGMVVLGGIGTKWIPPTQKSRGFHLSMRPKLPHEHVRRFDPEVDGARLRQLSAEATIWAGQNRDALKAARRTIPGLNSRAADNCAPLLAVAEVISDAASGTAGAASSGGWLSMLAATLPRFLFAQADDQRMLLRHICELLSDTTDPLPRHKIGIDGHGRVFSADLCTRLADRIDWPYRDLGQHDLAHRLGEFNLRPQPSQEGGRGSRNNWAYWVRDFLAIFPRYGITPDDPGTTARPPDRAVLDSLTTTKIQAWMLRLALAMRPLFMGAGYAFADQICVSIEPLHQSAIGTASAPDNTGISTIRISPDIVRQPLQVAETILHELAHIIIGVGSGHDKRFRDCIERLGLIGPPVATHAGPELRQRLQEMIAAQGSYPLVPEPPAEPPHPPGEPPTDVTDNPYPIMHIEPVRSGEKRRQERLLGAISREVTAGRLAPEAVTYLCSRFAVARAANGGSDLCLFLPDEDMNPPRLARTPIDKAGLQPIDGDHAIRLNAFVALVARDRFDFVKVLRPLAMTWNRHAMNRPGFPGGGSNS